MTTQAKYFINPSDLVAVRFECRNCHTSVSVAIQERIGIEAMTICPSCRQPWLSLPSTSIMPTVANFVKAANGLATALREWRQSLDAASVAGFDLQVEIKGPPPD